MRLLIIYDIPNDRIRTRVADACLDYGLERIQYSAFAGVLGRAHQRELELKVRRLLGRAPARVRFIPLDERLWERQQVIERRAPEQANPPNHGDQAQTISPQPEGGDGVSPSEEWEEQEKVNDNGTNATTPDE